MPNIFEADLEFDWDQGNLDKSWLKHQVSNQKSQEALLDPRAFLTQDFKHSTTETRYQLLAQTMSGKQLAIYFTLRNNKIRIISARPMSKKEKDQYEKV